jgi:hypothetical protein
MKLQDKKIYISKSTCYERCLLKKYFFITACISPEEYILTISKKAPYKFKVKSISINYN